jgi:ribbon-helix-helix CopG family protein
MITVSLKLSPGLHAKLTRAAKQRRQTRSTLVRTALEQYLNGRTVPSKEGVRSALELAGDLVGCVAGPGDLSTNPKYLEGFGK